MIKKNFKILLIEDNKTDKILIERQIRKIVATPTILHLKKLKEIKKAIPLFAPNVVLSDYNLQEYTGLDVLKHLNTLQKRIPLIFVTGTIDDEELAASTILTGANGYILKNNINSLHEKLKPYFTKIIDGLETEAITVQHNKVFNEMQIYLKEIRSEDHIIRASYHEIKRALKLLKSIN